MSSRVKTKKKKKEQRTLCLHCPNRTFAALQSITELVQQPLAGGKTLLACGHFNLRLTYLTWENKRQPSQVSVFRSCVFRRVSSDLAQCEHTSDKKSFSCHCFDLLVSIYRGWKEPPLFSFHSSHFISVIHSLPVERQFSPSHSPSFQSPLFTTLLFIPLSLFQQPIISQSKTISTSPDITLSMNEVVEWSWECQSRALKLSAHQAEPSNKQSVL